MNISNITDELLAKYLAGETNANDTVMVENWLKENSENKKELADYERIWQQTRHENPEHFDVDKAWLKMQSQLHKAKIQPLQKSLWLRYGMAASIALFLMFGGVWFYFSQKQELLSIATKNNTLQHHLPDGSSVFLNRFSSIKYPQNFQDNRKITLTGEGFFEVQHQDNQPFEVKTKETLVQVLGTAFNVNAYQKNVKVAVVRGKVSFEKNKQKVTLHKNETAEWHADKDTVMKMWVFDKNVLSYKTHSYVFEDSSLEHVIKVLSEGYQTRIVLKNKDLKACRLSTHFDNETLPNALNIIAETLNLNLIHENNRYVLEGVGCGKE